MFAIDKLIGEIDKRSAGRLTSTPLGGAQTKTVTRFAALEAADETQIAFLAQSKYRDAAKASRAGVLVLTQADVEAMYGDSDPARALIVTANPYAWFAWAVQAMLERPTPAGGVSERAFVEAGAELDPSAVVEAGAVVKAGAKIGARTRISSGAVVGEGTVVGEDSILYPNAVVYHGCRIGSRVILHSGCVIGADGFGFAPFAGEWVKIPQVGGVVIEDDVEIGANTTIDRGAIDNTVVGRGSKIDNQIQLGHNCRLGEHVVMAACTGVAGSTRIGNHSVIGGAANINGHIVIPEGSQVGPATSLMSWHEGAKTMMGFFPASDQRTFERAAVLVMNLPKMRQQLKGLEARLAELAERLEEK